MLFTISVVETSRFEHHVQLKGQDNVHLIDDQIDLLLPLLALSAAAAAAAAGDRVQADDGLLVEAEA